MSDNINALSFRDPKMLDSHVSGDLADSLWSASNAEPYAATLTAEASIKNPPSNAKLIRLILKELDLSHVGTGKSVNTIAINKSGFTYGKTRSADEYLTYGSGSDFNLGELLAHRLFSPFNRILDPNRFEVEEIVLRFPFDVRGNDSQENLSKPSNVKVSLKSNFTSPAPVKEFF